MLFQSENKINAVLLKKKISTKAHKGWWWWGGGLIKVLHQVPLMISLSMKSQHTHPTIKINKPVKMIREDEINGFPNKKF